MSQTPDEKPDNQSDSVAATLTRGVEKVLRKLIGFLVGKISLIKLQEMVRYIYIEESERKLRFENPDRDIPLTQLAVLTGMDTRTLAKTRNNKQYRKPIHEIERFVKSMTPESCVLDLWVSKPDYLDPVSGEPSKLNLTGEGPTFERLVKESVTSRGVTVQSILARLIKNQAVKIDEKNGSIELLENILAPYKVGNHWGVFEVGVVQICNLFDTIFYNIKMAKTGGKPFYGRGCWTHRLSHAQKSEFQKHIKRFLEKADTQARKEITLFEELEAKPNQMTAGVHMFYFEEDVVEG
jgi:hypothetical protein